MTRRRALSAILLLAAAAGHAWAHDGHIHKIMGTITVRDEKHLEVKTPSGETLSIAINEKTSVLQGKRKADLAELKVGIRVVVDTGKGESPLVAREVQLGVAAAQK